MLRNPVDVMYAQHNQLIFNVIEDIPDFKEALDAEPGAFLLDPTLVRDFGNLYRYYRDAQLRQLVKTDTQLLAVFQSAPAYVLALSAGHSPADVRFYCLDFGGGALSPLRTLPHVGSVAGRADTDLIRRTVADVATVLRDREAAFRRRGVDSTTAHRRRRAAGDTTVIDDPFGDVFLVIDGWATVRQDHEHLEEAIQMLELWNEVRVLPGRVALGIVDDLRDERVGEPDHECHSQGDARRPEPRSHLVASSSSGLFVGSSRPSRLTIPGPTSK